MRSRLANTFKTFLSNHQTFFSVAKRQKSYFVPSINNTSYNISSNFNNNQYAPISKKLTKLNLEMEKYNSALDEGFKLISTNDLGPAIRKFSEILSQLLDLHLGGIKIDDNLLAKAYYGKAKASALAVPHPKEFSEVIHYFEEAIRLDPTNQEAKDYLEDFLMDTGIKPIIEAKKPSFS